MTPRKTWPVEIKKQGNAWTVLFGGREEARCRNERDAAEIGRDIANRTNSVLSVLDDNDVRS